MDNNLKVIVAAITAVVVIVSGLFIYKSSAESSFQENAPEWLDYDRVSFNPFTGNFDIQEVEVEILKELLDLKQGPSISNITTNFAKDGGSIYLAAEGVSIDLDDVGYGSLLRSGDMFKRYLNFLDVDAFTGSIIINIDRNKSDNEAEVMIELNIDQLAIYTYNLSLLKVNPTFRDINKLADYDFKSLTTNSGYYGNNPTPSGLLLASVLEKMAKMKLIEATFSIEDSGYFEHYSSVYQKIQQSIIPSKNSYLKDCLEGRQSQLFDSMECYLEDGSLTNTEFSLSPRKAIKLFDFIGALKKGVSPSQFKKFNIEGDV